MDEKLSRRSLLVASLAFLASGCRVRTTDDPAPGPARPVSPIARLPASGQWYEVAPGDTLVGISRRAGIPLASIIDGNGGIRAADVRPGLRLWLPGATLQQLEAVVAGRRPAGSPIPADEELDDERAAPAGAFVLVPRSAWTKQGVGANRNPMNGVSRITVHHTGEHAGLANLPEVEVLRRIERYHRNERRWCAIGYHYIIGKDGKVYEGRPAKWQGAHVLSENEHNLGISVAGDFMRHLPNAKQLRALEAFLDDRRREYGVAKKRVFGHRDLNQSLCPGDALYAWLRRYKSA
jgi:hypothetical protein